jgi:hypothetical protein
VFNLADKLHCSRAAVRRLPLKEFYEWLAFYELKGDLEAKALEEVTKRGGDD